MEFTLIALALIAFAFLSGKKAPSASHHRALSQAPTVLAKRGIGRRRGDRRFLGIEKPDISLGEQARSFLNTLENSNINFFLTGRAGTGKSTLLKYFRATTKKRVVVLAPTGVAAVNVQGQTIHSFFGWGPQITRDAVGRRSGTAAKIYREVDTIVIDEISMVRADLFDCIDKFMRLNGRSKDKPFGGVQLLVIGDLYQLPPIVRQEEETFFRRIYLSPFFFDSDVYKAADFQKVELTEVHRQTDREFIEILDAIRECVATEQQLKTINARVFPNYERPTDEFTISLVTKNRMADATNTRELALLPEPAKVYRGTISGEFKETDRPTLIELVLKEGAQVMLLNNHPSGRWVNGDLAKVIRTDPNSVRVLFEDGTFDDVGAYEWDSVRFVYDEEARSIRAEVIGTFTQIPLKLAWAITIHKSQGKTFERIHIDFGDGTFAAGQAYVALSRCRSLEGIILATPLKDHHIFADERVRAFMGTMSSSSNAT